MSNIVVISINQIPDHSWSALVDAVYEENAPLGLTRDMVRQWFYNHYQARDISILGRPLSTWEFPQDKYVEFCLTWM